MIKLTVPLALSSLAKPASSSWSRSPLVSRPKDVRRLLSSPSSALRSTDEDYEGALVMHFDRSDFAGETFSRHVQVADCALVFCLTLQ